ncbi:hypothetical protein SY88_17345 [Clostridiales bacterium PH28_bin88]|nr:hypothetical protein SY88_17345 [Clostridiales bacterium PH28_bin88]
MMSEKGRYIHPGTGYWYIARDKYIIIPKEEYVSRSEFGKMLVQQDIQRINRGEIAFIYEPRPNEVWQLVGYGKILVEPGDTLDLFLNTLYFSFDEYNYSDFHYQPASTPPPLIGEFHLKRSQEYDWDRTKTREENINAWREAESQYLYLERNALGDQF